MPSCASRWPVSAPATSTSGVEACRGLCPASPSDTKWWVWWRKSGSRVTRIKPGDRVTVNVETFCGECYFCRHGWVNNCTDPNGGWALGCRIDGGQAEYVRVPYADQGLNQIPDSVTDEQALLVGNVLATGYWAAQISEIKPQDTVLIIGMGLTGICAL